MNKGTTEHPFRNIRELQSGIIGRSNCTLYTYGSWELPKELTGELKNRNIKLLGVMVAYVDGNELVKSLEKDLIDGVVIDNAKGILTERGYIR